MELETLKQSNNDKDRVISELKLQMELPHAAITQNSISLGNIPSENGKHTSRQVLLFWLLLGDWVQLSMSILFWVIYQGVLRYG